MKKTAKKAAKPAPKPVSASSMAKAKPAASPPALKPVAKIAPGTPPPREASQVGRGRAASCPAEPDRNRFGIASPVTPISPSKTYGWFQRPSQDDLLAYCAWAAIASSRDCMKPSIDTDSFKQSFHYEVDESVGVKVVAPSVFMWIRKTMCSTTEAVWRAGWEFPFKSSSSAGKSGANFARAHNESFFLKSITDSEMRVVRTILPDLYEHFKAHPASLINKIMGLFTVEAKGKLNHYIAVANVLHKSAPLFCTFDLKGSTTGRVAHPDQHKKEVPLLKDVDWVLAEHKIKMPAPKYDELCRALRADVKFLYELGVMDYSLFVAWSKKGVQKAAPGSRTVYSANDTFYLGIIDFLQMYNMSRKLAHAAKGMVSDASTISTVPPKEYSERFEKFVIEQVLLKTGNAAVRGGGSAVRRVPPNVPAKVPANVPAKVPAKAVAPAAKASPALKTPTPTPTPAAKPAKASQRLNSSTNRIPSGSTISRAAHTPSARVGGRVPSTVRK